MAGDRFGAQNPKRRARGARKSGDGAPHAIALYHVVRADEGFETAATMLFEMVRHGARTHPGKRRVLYLDIEGHRNDQGGYDHDMFELQQSFVIGFLLPYLSGAHLP